MLVLLSSELPTTIVRAGNSTVSCGAAAVHKPCNTCVRLWPMSALLLDSSSTFHSCTLLCTFCQRGSGSPQAFPFHTSVEFNVDLPRKQDQHDFPSWLLHVNFMIVSTNHPSKLQISFYFPQSCGPKLQANKATCKAEAPEEVGNATGTWPPSISIFPFQQTFDRPDRGCKSLGPFSEARQPQMRSAPPAWPTSHCPHLDRRESS